MTEPINWRRVQQRLAVKTDGIAGPLTWAALLRWMGCNKLAPLIGEACAKHVPAYGIADNKRRLTHWLGQNAHESGGFNRLEESLNYSSAARIQQVWPSRFPTLASAQAFVRNPQGLAERVYGDRMGNETGVGFGWRYRGRGIKMITGLNNYRWMAESTGIDIVEDPDLAATPDGAVHLSCAYWAEAGCHKLADEDAIARLSNLINRGRAVSTPPAIGFQDRVQRTARARELFV